MLDKITRYYIFIIVAPVLDAARTALYARPDGRLIQT